MKRPPWPKHWGAYARFSGHMGNPQPDLETLVEGFAWVMKRYALAVAIIKVDRIGLSDADG